MVHQAAQGRAPSLFAFEIGLNNAPWRLTAAWGVLFCTVLALGLAKVRLSWLTVAWVLILIDAVWGYWWRLATTIPVHTSEAPGRAWLPYARANAPWAQVGVLFPERFWSGVIFSLLVSGVLVSFLGPAAMWANAMALLAAVAVWWLARVFPAALPWVRAAYVGAAPLAAGYVVGGVSLTLILVSLGLTLGLWSRLGQRWHRYPWAIASLATWAAGALLVVPSVIAGALAVVVILALVSARRTDVYSDVLWLLALAGLSGAAWLI